jgi:signal transduction histidine kinase
VVTESRTRTAQGTVDAAADMVLWKAAAGVAVALVAAYWLVPDEYVTFRALVLYPAVDVAAVVAIVYGVRHYRPRAPTAWLLIAAALTSVTVADTIYGLYEVAAQEPFPSLADVFYLAAYPLYAAGLHVASRARLPEGDRGAFIDAAIVTVTAALFAFLLIANTYVADPSIALAPTVVASAYPLADVLLLALAVRFLLGANWRVPALQLLALGLALTLAGDVLYSLGELFTHPGDSRTADAVLLTGVLALGLAGLHPSMTELTTEPARAAAPEYSVPRVVSLYLVSMVPVVVLSVQALTSDAANAWITTIALVLVTSLVLMRFMDLASQTRAATARQTTLGRFSASLLDRSGRAELLATANRVAGELVPDGTARVVEHDVPPVDGRQVFVVPVEVDGKVVAVVAADGPATALRGVRDALGSLARGLSLALEREALLEEQKATAAGLAEQNAQLRELDRMKDQLVSSVSHELRTPLTSMGGYVELLLDEELGDLNADQRRFAEVIDRNCRRLNRLIDDILFVARVDAGRLSLERGWVDVADVAAGSVETARVRAQQGDVALELTTGPDLPPLWADPTRLGQMFDNLLSNAIKFTPPGGAVRVDVTGTGGAVQVEVADTGIGIPAGELDRLFERFFRTSTVGAVAGTGLGLSIVKSIVEVHDGTIDVRSTEGVGTTFRIMLPAQPRTGAQQAVQVDVGGSDAGPPAAAGQR